MHQSFDTIAFSSESHSCIINGSGAKLKTLSRHSVKTLYLISQKVKLILIAVILMATQFTFKELTGQET